MRLRCLCVVALASCAVAPPDLYPEAERSARDGRLLRALALLEQIPSAHPRRPECQRLWSEVEQRIRLAHVRVAEALGHHAGGDVEMANQLLAAVQADWPEAPGLSEAVALVARPVLFPAAPASEPELPSSEPAPRTIATPSPEVAPAAAPVATAPPDVPLPPAVVGEAVIESPVPDAKLAAVAGDPAQARSESPRQPVSAAASVAVPDLAMLRSLAQGRDIPAAIDRLDAEQRLNPGHTEIIELLTGLLRRRALVAYGRGWLEAAIEDWARIVELVPGDREASGNLTTARAELARRSTPRERR